MAVTDLTDDLPWWTRQSAGPTGGPAAAPQGAGGQPGAGDSASWLQYLSQMFGVSPAQAATMMQNPANMPSANAGNMSFAGHVAAAPPMTNFGNPAPTAGPGPGNVGPVDLDGHGTGDNPPVQPFVVPPAPPQANPPAPAGPSILPQARGVAVPPGPMASGPAGAGPSILPQARGVAVQPGPMAPGSSILPAGAATASSPLGPPLPPGGFPSPLATGGAGGVGATSNPRFVQLNQGQNIDPTARNRGPQMTALNLAGLFGGGASPATAPAGARVAGPLAGKGRAYRNV